MSALRQRICSLSAWLLCLLLCVSLFSSTCWAFSYNIAPGTPDALEGTAEHRTAAFNSKGYDVSAGIISMDAIRGLMLREHEVDLYRYGVDEHLCTSTFQAPQDCSSCHNASEVSQWFQQYASGKILLALRGPPSLCQSSPSPPAICGECTFQLKSANAFQLNASALVLGQNTTTDSDTPCQLSSDDKMSGRETVPTVIIFNSRYGLINQALQNLASKQDPIPASGELTDKISNGYVSPQTCQAKTGLLFLVLQIGAIPFGLVLSLYSLKTKLMPQAEEASRQQQNQRRNNQNQQAGQNEQQQQANNVANPAPAAEPGQTPHDSHAVTIAPSSSSSVEEKSSNSFAGVPSSLPGSALAIRDGLELDEFRSTASSRSNSRTLTSSSIDEQALLSSDALGSDPSAGGSLASSGGRAGNRRMDVEDFNRRALIESHRRLYGILDTILAFSSAKALFYGSLLYNFTLLLVLEIIIVNARDEACKPDLKLALLYRAGVCFAAIFHAFGQSFSNIPSIMRLFFYTRAAGVFFSLMFFTSSVAFIFLRQSSVIIVGEEEEMDCSTRAPLSSSSVVALLMLFLAGGVELFLMRVMSQAYDAYTKGRTTVAPASEGLLVLLGRAVRKHALSGCVLFGPLDQPEPVTTLQLSLLPTTTFHEGMYSTEDAVCAICLGNYEAGERLRILPCLGAGHHFHSSCLDQWITSQKPTCPTCRRPIPLSYEQYEEEERLQANQNDNVANDSNVRRGERRRDGRMAVPVEDI